MKDNVYTKEKMPLNEREEDLKSLEEEYNHVMEDWRIVGKTGRGVLCCHTVTQKCLFQFLSYLKYFSITTGDVLVLPQLVKYVFYHNYLVDKNFFHCSLSTTFSIAAGQLLLPLQLVNYFFHCKWSTTCSIAAGQLLLPLQLVNYFFHCSWSTTSSGLCTGGVVTVYSSCVLGVQ